MRKFFCFVALGACTLATPALAKSSDYDPPYENEHAGGSREVEREIQRLDAQIDAADREDRISGGEADSLISALQRLESRLQDIRERPSSGHEDLHDPGARPDDEARDRPDDRYNENRDSGENPDDYPGNAVQLEQR